MWGSSGDRVDSRWDKSDYSSGDYAGDFHSMSFSSHEFNTPWASAETREGNFWVRTINGFRRDPSLMVTSRGSVSGADGRTFDAEAAAIRTADSPLMRKLKGRHLQMIAFGGSIGTQ